MSRFSIAACLLVLASPGIAAAQSLPAAITTDPPADKASPAGMEVLHVPSGGVEINAIAYTPTGKGPHPVLVLFHGLPGNEKNLDLAQTLRRAGWTVIAPNYRGSWGSPGSFSFQNTLDDGEAVLAWLAQPANAARIKADPGRIAIAGHSMGGWVVAQTAARHPELKGAILISAADMGLLGKAFPLEKGIRQMQESMESLAGTTPEAMAREIFDRADRYTLAPHAAALARVPLLVLSSDDGLAPLTDRLVAQVRAAGGTKVTTEHAATDHGWSDHRIFLQKAMIDWLATLE